MFAVVSFIVMIFAHFQYHNWFLGSQVVLLLLVVVYVANWRTFLGAVTLARVRPDKYPMWKWNQKYRELAEEEIPQVEKALEKWV